jgi:MFS family permease
MIFAARLKIVARIQSTVNAVGSFILTVVVLQSLSSFPWGWISDRIGRKLVVMIGGMSACLSVVGLGLAGSYPAAVASRFCGGLFNGTIGALKSIIAETYTPSEQARVCPLSSCVCHPQNCV